MSKNLPVLPCHVGDTVYVICSCADIVMHHDNGWVYGTGVLECPFEADCLFEDCADELVQILKTDVVDCVSDNGDYILYVRNLQTAFKLEDFGVSVFLSHDEANARLTGEGVSVCEAVSSEASAIVKDVHTEHCCKKHGCKYGDSDCTFTMGVKEQSYPCELCTIASVVLEPCEESADVSLREVEAMGEVMTDESSWDEFLRRKELESVSSPSASVWRQFMHELPDEVGSSCFVYPVLGAIALAVYTGSGWCVADGSVFSLSDITHWKHCPFNPMDMPI